MTTITFVKNQNGEYKRFTCQGHAGFAEKGYDIVCAAVSCLVINTINSMDELAHEDLEITTDEKRGVINCSIRRSLSQKGILLMDSLVLGLKGIAADYNEKFLELKFKEV